MSDFKDKCDNCGKFDYLIGYGNKCLCHKCQNGTLKTPKLRFKQMTIFDMLGMIKSDYKQV